MNRTLRRTSFRITVFAVTVLAVGACGLFPVHIGPDAYSDSANVFYHDLDNVNHNRTIRYAVVVGREPRDVYVVFTNPTIYQAAAPLVDVRSVLAVVDEPAPLSSAARAAAVASLAAGPVALRDHPAVAGWEPPPLDGPAPRTTTAAPAANLVPGPEQYGGTYQEASQGGESFMFSVDTSPDVPPIESVLAVRRTVGTMYGPKTLEIWVEKDVWDAEDVWGGIITQGKADAMADAFLRDDPGSGAYDNDIYDWVSSVFGEEWSEAAGNYSNTIDGLDTITILLYDIEADGRAGGIVGYFWAKDNFARDWSPYSNERIMFYIDSSTYGAKLSGEGSWSIDNFWPNEIVSTLAHELQHMINFHQRSVLRGARTPTWLDEAMSLAAEDLVEYKRLRSGPRGVDPRDYGGTAGPTNNRNGRLPAYNLANDYSLTFWPSHLAAIETILSHYGVSYAFAAFLGRNYGGAQVFREMSRSSATSVDTLLASSIRAAGGPAGMTLKQLLWQWGAAVILSDAPRQTPYRLNTGTWTNSSAGSVTHRLGSIDHYRYRDALFVHAGVIGAAEMEPASKLLYRVGSGLTGTVELDLELADGIDFTVVVK